MRTLEMHEPFCRCGECQEYKGKIGGEEIPFKLEVIEPIPPNENVFLHDLYNMGTKLARNVMVMHHTHGNEKASYIIVVNTETGQRLRVCFD